MRYLIFSLSFCFINLVVGQSDFRNDRHYRSFINKHFRKSINSSGTDYSESLDPKQCRIELRILKRALEEGQPQLYRYASKAKIDDAFSTAFKACRWSISYKDYMKELGKIRHVIGAGHARLEHSKAYKYYALESEVYFPFDIRYEGHDCKIYRDCSGNIELIPSNSNLVSINKESISDIIERMRVCTDRDGLSNESSSQVYTEDFSLKYCVFIDSPEEFEICYQDAETGIKRIITVDALHFRDMNANRNKRYSIQTRDVLSQSFDDSTAYFRVGSFLPSHLKKKGYDYKDYTDAFFKKVSEYKVQELYIDLRGNLGGALDYAEHLLSYLIDEQTPYIRTEVKKLRNHNYELLLRNDWSKFRSSDSTKLDTVTGRYFIVKKQMIEPATENVFYGKIYVLTDNLTQSCAAAICSILEERSNAVFIGEEVGSPKVGSTGNPVSLELPYSRIHYVFPEAWHHNIVVKDDDSSLKGVQPDVKVINRPMELYDWPFFMELVDEYNMRSE